jgi:hypothetical protein
MLKSGDKAIAPKSYYFNDTASARTGVHLYGLLLNDPSTGVVFSELLVDGESVMTAWGLTGKTVKRDIFCHVNSHITGYTLASGEVLELSNN